MGKSALISNLFTPFHLEQVAAAPSNASGQAAASSSRKDLASTGTPRRLDTSPGELSRAALELTEYTATATDAAGGAQYHYSIVVGPPDVFRYLGAIEEGIEGCSTSL